MSYPTDIRFTATHEWVLYTGETTAKIGISDYAQKAMGDIVFINLPEPGDEVTAGKSFSDMESVKAVEDVLSPVSGRVVAVNDALADAPEQLNSDPYGAWIIEVENVCDCRELMDEEAYKEFCAREG